MDYSTRHFSIKNLRWFFYDDNGHYLGSEPEYLKSIQVEDGDKIKLNGCYLHPIDLTKSEVEYYVIRDRFKKELFFWHPQNITIKKFCEINNIQNLYFERVQLKKDRDITKNLGQWT